MKKALRTVVALCIFIQADGLSGSIDASEIYRVGKPPKECKLDGKIAVLFDTSTSIVKQKQDNNLKKYVAELTKFLLDPKRRLQGKPLKISIAQFATQNHFGTLRDFEDTSVGVNEIIQRVRGVEFSNGSCLSHALKQTENSFKRDKQSSKEAIIYVGDGNADCYLTRGVSLKDNLRKWNTQAVKNMQKIKDKGVAVIAFGFIEANRHQITKLASSANNAYFYKDMDGENLNNALITTLKKICSNNGIQTEVDRKEAQFCKVTPSGHQPPKQSVCVAKTPTMKAAYTWTVKFSFVFENVMIVSKIGNMYVQGGRCIMIQHGGRRGDPGEPARPQDCSRLYADLALLYRIIEQDRMCEKQLGVCTLHASQAQAKAQKGTIVYMDDSRVNLDLCTTDFMYKGWSGFRTGACAAVSDRLQQMGM